jgi:tetratricopeptide (TPR) repeat protein
MSQPPFDLAAAHRWFAVEFNNQAWDLLEAAERTDEQTEQMLHTAHAAWLHWAQAGSVLNRQRAECLLASAYAAAGRVEPAVRYGRSCVQLSQQPDSEQTPFDQATAHACLARALSLAGQTEEAAEHHRQASLAAEGLTDAGERQVYAQLYPQS